jgi:hypothetical protein
LTGISRFHYPDAESRLDNDLDNTMNTPTTVPLLTLLRERRSRRFGLGMRMSAGPLAYASRFSPVPLSEEEEAALVFAASGITGHALADLCYTTDGGGGIMAGLVGRTIASGDGLQTVALIVINDNATYLVRRPRELPPQRIEELIQLGRQNRFAEIYRSCRVKIKDGRAVTPTEPLFNINANRWSAHANGTSYFLPINDLTFMYVNGLLEILNESTGAFILDERNSYRPAGLDSFAKSRGGHLEDDPRRGKVATVRQVEQFVNEFVTIEQGMIHQNLALMAEALGLGGFPNFANHEFGWLEALGFRMQHMRASQYLGVNRLVALGMKLLKRDVDVPYAVGLEREGEVLLRPFCPPYYASMSEAVRAVAALKFGTGGIFRGHAAGSAWINPAGVTEAVPPVSGRAIEATIAYCEYLWRRYGRFPVYLTPFRTVLGFQACHVDVEFYEKFYQPEALSSRQREDFESRAASKGPSAA